MNILTSVLDSYSLSNRDVTLCLNGADKITERLHARTDGHWAQNKEDCHDGSANDHEVSNQSIYQLELD